MKNYDKDNVPEKVIAELGLLVEDPLFTPEAMIAGSQESGEERRRRRRRRCG